MNVLLGIALGGAMGALARYGCSILALRLFGTYAFLGTLAVNVLGSLALGAVIGFATRLNVLPIVHAVFAIGFLGAFTTFSTFSVETLRLMQDGRILWAGSYALGSVVLSVLSAWIGYKAATL